MTNGKEHVQDSSYGRVKHIPSKEVHRLEGPIEVLELARGSDDVVRLEDDYGRV